jgi:hypothetical protein
MVAILFSVDPSIVDMNDAINHLRKRNELYFETKFDIIKKQYSFPLLGFIHSKGDGVRWCVKIKDIIDFKKDHYEDPYLAEKVKPKKWIDEWKHNINGIRNAKWKHALIITDIAEVSHDTKKIELVKGGFVEHPPQRYYKIKPPSEPFKLGLRKPIGQERKVLIENNSINSVINYYVKLGYNVESVEKENIGYDLIANKNDKELYVEVKGTSEKNVGNITVGLTPKEYKTSNKKQDKFRICVVSDALGTPVVHEFLWNRSKGYWRNESASLRLNLEQIISVNIKIEKMGR